MFESSKTSIGRTGLAAVLTFAAALQPVMPAFAGPNEQAKRLFDRLTGTPPGASVLQQMSADIRAYISGTAGGEAAAGVRILYGGSVKADNITPIMAGQDVDGVLVGGASLDAGQFASICRYYQVAAGR